MKHILLTIDTEFYISKDEILGIDGKYGIDDILHILNEAEIKATFFIDYFSIKKWGEDIFNLLHEKIRAANHDIQLHLHPFIAGGKSYLWEYDEDEQREYIEAAIAYYQKFNSSRPLFFRAGGYAVNQQTIAILKENGFLADLSFQFKQKRCRIPETVFPHVNKPDDLDGLLEIPTTVFKYYYPFVRYNSVNLEWCSLAELKSILKKIKKSPLENIVVMMHSFGLQNRKDRKKVNGSPYKKKKFRKFLSYAKKNDCNFLTVDDFYRLYAESDTTKSKDNLPVIKNPWIIISGLTVRFFNYWILKRAFRRKIAAGGFLLFLLLSLMLYLVFFNFIEPSVQDSENYKVDVHSWNEDNDLSTIEYYYIFNKNDISLNTEKKTDEGIIFRRGFEDERKFQLKINTDTLFIPTDMSGAIIYYFNLYQRSPKSIYIDRITLYANWLEVNAQIRKNMAVWTHPYGFSKYGLKPGWTGAWALGNILSAIARYYQITGDKSFLELGKKAVKSFNTGIKEGGILAIDEGNNYWFEEYPAIPKNSVLNGHIHGILGLFDFWRVTGDTLALVLVHKGITTVRKNLYRYDSGYWSYYDLKYPFVADYFYHTDVHIPQLKILYQITHEEIFREYALKWETYLSEPYFTVFKLKILYDALCRRILYKSFFTWGK